MATERHQTIDIGNGYLLLVEDFNNFESFKISLRDKIDLLPQWDCYTIGYAPDGRERFASSDMQEKIYGSLGATGGNALGTVLVNGMAHGAWSFRFQGNQMNVTLNMFEKPTMKLNKNIVNQINEIAVLLKANNLVIENN